jgi:hypothetical protein
MLTSLWQLASRQLTHAAGMPPPGQLVTPYPPPLLLLLHANSGTAIATAHSTALIPFVIFIGISSQGHRPTRLGQL